MTDIPGSGTYASQSYWRKRSDMLYYRYIDWIVRATGANARSLIDVGSGNCPYLDWFDWIPERVSVDIRVPYAGPGIRSITGDIHRLTFPERFDICSCLQVLEHVPEAGLFAQRLLTLGRLVIVSVPYKWSTTPVRTQGHIHDPVDYEKLTRWMGREANYKIIVEEPFSVKKNKRLIALYDEDPERKFNSSLREGMIVR